jgi:hypothetical protein
VLRVELCGASVLGEATVLEMIFVGATMLDEATATVLIRATALKASVPMEIYGIIEATVLKVDPESVGSMD